MIYREDCLEKTTQQTADEVELEEARQNITLYDVILEDDESARFDELQKKHWEATINYEQQYKRG